LEFEIDEVRFDEVEGAFEIERQNVVDLHDKQDFQIATHQFFKDDEYTKNN
jgi:CMP-N-acetylneuraminic acid synthetase